MQLCYTQWPAHDWSKISTQFLYSVYRPAGLRTGIGFCKIFTEYSVLLIFLLLFGAWLKLTGYKGVIYCPFSILSLPPMSPLCLWQLVLPYQTLVFKVIVPKDVYTKIFIHDTHKVTHIWDASCRMDNYSWYVTFIFKVEGLYGHIFHQISIPSSPQGHKWF